MSSRSFTITANSILRVLQSDCAIGPAFIGPDAEQLGPPDLKNYKAIWDTGATGSVITQKVVDDLGLKPIGMTMAHGVQGQHMTEVFLVCMGLATTAFPANCFGTDY